MNRDVGVVLLSALLATLNPSLLAAVTVMLLLPHPRRLMAGYLLGAYTTSIVAGLVIVYSLHGSGVVKASSHGLSPAAELAIGAVALIVALRLATRRDALRRRYQRRRETKARNKPAGKPWQTRFLEKGSAPVAFVVGAAVSFPGVTYVNALDHIAQLNPPTVPLLALVFYFCLMQQILIEGALLTYTFAPEWTQGAIVKFRAWLMVLC